jgi:hypothetical protein
MKRGLYLAPFHELADPRLLAELARVAESRGWDGLLLWDRIAYPPSDRAVGGTQRHRFQDGQPSYRADDHSALAEARPEGRTGDGHDRTAGGVRDRTGPGRKRAHSHGRAGGEHPATRQHQALRNDSKQRGRKHSCDVAAGHGRAVLAFTRQRPQVRNLSRPPTNTAGQGPPLVVVAGCPDGGRRRTGGGRIQRGPHAGVGVGGYVGVAGASSTTPSDPQRPGLLALLRPRRHPRPTPARHHQPVNPTSPHLPRPWDRGCRVAERSCLMLWLSLAHAQALGSRTCCQERRASKSRIGLVRPGSSMAPSPSKRTPATEVIATTGSLTSTWPPRA